MGNFFNGNTINHTPVPLIPQQQVVIPPITIPNLNSNVTQPSYNQITVKGKDAAKAYRLGPNSQVAIFDEDESIFYYRETDASGNDVSFKTCRYEEVEEPAPPEYLTVQEFRSSLDEFAQKLKEELVNGKFIQSKAEPQE